jgi:hypothetical protein
MVSFDGKEYKPSLCSKLKEWFAKWFSRKPKSVLKTSLIDAIDPKKCVLELDTKIFKDSDLTTMAKLREEFLIKKYHLIGSHNAMISAMNDDVNNFKHFAENCVNMKSQFKILSNFFELIKEGPTKEWVENPGLGTQKMNDAINALNLLIRCNNDIEKSYNTHIKKLQAKILNRSVLIGDLTRAENMDELKSAEKDYKNRSKQKITKEKQS